MLFFAEDLLFFYGTVYGGILIGLLFDINRSIKSNFKALKKCSFIFDISFWIISTIIMFITINTMEFFNLRYYHFIALILGFILYYTTISKYVLLILNKLISLIKNTVSLIIKYIALILESLYYMLIYVVHLTLDILFLIFGVIFSGKKVIRRKSRN